MTRGCDLPLWSGTLGPWRVVRASEGTIGAQFPSWHFRRLKVVATWQPSAAMTFIALSSMTGLLERSQP